jgi:hypothetical protein
LKLDDVKMFERQKTMFGAVPAMTWREKYNSVIASKRWRSMRARRFDKTGGRCERCAWKQTQWHKGRGLELHHLNYERLGEEKEGDLELLCQRCHAVADVQRATEGQMRSSDALYEARFNGWASKVYGDDWYGLDVDEMHERFVEWLDELD